MRRYAVTVLGGRGHALDSGERVEERLAASPDHAIELAQLAAGEVALDVQPLDPEPRLLLSRAEAARMLGVGVSTFDTLGVAQVRLRDDARALYDPEDLRALIEARKRT